MKPLLIKVWISVLAFWLGIIVSSLWKLHTLPPIPEAIEILPLTAVATVRTQSKTEPLSRISASHACGPKGSWHVQKLSDGALVVTDCRLFSSQAAARRALQSQLSKVTLVVEQSENQEGEKVVAEADGIVELNRSGRSLCVTKAPSLKHLRWWTEPYSAPIR